MPFTPSPGSLAEDFMNGFEIILADTDALRERVFQVRQQVFCRELGYAMQNNGLREADSYDPQSLHCLLRHRATNLDAGCVRLVLPLLSQGLPFEQFGLPHVDRQQLNCDRLDPRCCCEISRLAVIGQFRRRLGERTNPEGICDDSEPWQAGPHRRFPFIAISLYHAAIALILQHGYQWAFMVVEPRLQRHMQRFGIRVRQISPEFEHFGQRAVYVTTDRQLRTEMDAWKVDWQGLYSNVHWQLLKTLPQLPDSSDGVLH